MEKSYRIDELAAAWGVHHATIRRLITSGRLKAFRVGRQWRILSEERQRVEARMQDLFAGVSTK